MHKNQRFEINNTQQFDYVNKNNTSSNNHNLNKNSFETPINQEQMFYPQQQVPLQPNMSNMHQYRYNQLPLQHNSQFNNISYPNVIHQRGYSLPASQHCQLGFNLHSNAQHSMPNIMSLGPYSYPSSSANPNLDFMPPPVAIPPFQYSTTQRTYSPRLQSSIEPSTSLYQYSGQNQLQLSNLNAPSMNMEQLHNQNIQQQLQPEMSPLSPNGSIKNQPSIQSLMNTNNSSLLLGVPYQMPNHEIYPKSSTAWLPKDDALLRFVKEYRKLGWREISMYFPTRTLNACQFRWRRLIAGVITNKKNKNKDKDEEKDKNMGKEKEHQNEHQNEHPKEENKPIHREKIKVEDRADASQLNLRNKRNIEDDGEKNDRLKKIKIEK